MVPQVLVRNTESLDHLQTKSMRFWSLRSWGSDSGTRDPQKGQGCDQEAALQAEQPSPAPCLPLPPKRFSVGVLSGPDFMDEETEAREAAGAGRSDPEYCFRLAPPPLPSSGPRTQWN